MGRRSGIRADHFELANIQRLSALYYEMLPDADNPLNEVVFGTSGHRGTPLNASFTQKHIEAITQAIVQQRRKCHITGPLFIGLDTHALSECALHTALEVLCANEVETVVQNDFAYTPTPVISREIVRWNLSHPDRPADGIIITPSHNPPQDGGFKYNPPHGGPASPEYTAPIAAAANEILKNGCKAVHRLTWQQTQGSPCLHFKDMRTPYVTELASVINLQDIAGSGLKIAVNPQGGASLLYWDQIAEQYQLNLEVINRRIDPTFSFMPYDYDDNIRMDCMSPYTMQPLIELKDKFDFCIANDPDADRHGIVTRQGLLNSNKYLCSIIHYLCRSRQNWPADAAVGKTIGASIMMDKIIEDAGRKVFETPIGFKWFSGGLFRRELVFGCEESAGASYLDLNGRPFTTDKDGFLAGLIGAEMCAVSGLSADDYYARLTGRFGTPYYGRIDAITTPEGKQAFAKLTEKSVTSTMLAGQPIKAVMTRAPGNQAPIGGIKVLAENCWFSARPSGTENIYKIYFESFISPEHLQQVREDAVNIVNHAIKS
ncbi:MAG: alpha-D-glucose phosphate-specific phosphoglucomutase [Proteobacteria bacterium]|uniref:Alpha-D-glucose phosphate-specific phosphoglucomutase n=1 Tax=Candidatus Avisuccinivibrio stercorigallinarum TaxID=2840704 RepID=A0A9D9GU15_9GAMM|nr:alpha-D-glucose phosphate-specific phosphoglucomutase [Candidatus Avisuccinivibrio stercorigallinarum]